MKISSKLSLFCGAVLIALGGFVVFAWLTNNISAIQIRPTLVPMPITVAIGFIFSGLGLIFLYYFRFRETQGVGTLTLVLGGLALGQFLFSVTISSTFLSSGENAPFRPMTPITALGFSLTGIAFLAVSNERTLPKGTLISGILGTLVFALGSVALFAHLLDLNSTEGWGKIIRMAVHSPGGFGILAVGLISFAWTNEQQKVIGSPQWLPVLVGVGIITLTLGLWIHFDIQEHSFVQTAVLVFGLLMAGLLSIAVYFIQRERRFLDQISLSHQGLEQQINERKQVENQLRNSQEALRNLSHRLQSIREEEKTKIAREVHDELGQVLTALKMDLSFLRETGSQDTEAFQEKIKSMADLLDQTVGTVQRICLELRPKILDVFGLPDAIEWQTKEFQRHTGIDCTLLMEKENIQLDSDRSLTCFRVLQEALTNVARHANATHVEIRIVQENGFLQLDVQDNGEGIADNKIVNSHSLGLIGIRERVLHWGGTVTIEGRSGEGTEVSIYIPYRTPTSN